MSNNKKTNNEKKTGRKINQYSPIVLKVSSESTVTNDVDFKYIFDIMHEYGIPSIERTRIIKGFVCKNKPLFIEFVKSYVKDVEEKRRLMQ